MEPKYDHKLVEEKIYRMWESGGYFTPKINKKKKPFTIILPLPNANDPMHMGHALFTVQDILVRYHRMLGQPTLWLPGADHAGIETQYVFEKKLAKEGKSRFDYDSATFYKMIWDFVEENRAGNRDQLKRLGFSLDWTRYHYSLDPDIIGMALTNFEKLYNDGLVYQGFRIVNFCTKCGTAFSDLEVNYEERDDKLYYLDYGPISIATTRPETIFADVAVAVNPKDKRSRELIGKSAVIPLINKKIPIITDEAINIKFGTGALKVTPAHDQTDFEIGERHNLEKISVIDENGKLNQNTPEKYQGLKVAAAREQVIADLKAAGKLLKEEPLRHSVGTCYKCSTVIEPLITHQWFIKTKDLAKKAIDAVRLGQTKIIPKKRFEKMYFDWLENIRDWNISRQIVWGVKIPIWYCAGCGKTILSRQKPQNCPDCPVTDFDQEMDTFDTWFLSGQWPVNTLNAKPGDFEYFYPTTVMDTMWDILFFWVGRMMMLGLYLTGKVPFKIIHIHARIVDQFGKKMSKSKGNVLDPMIMIDKYGADAIRMALIIGVAPASDIAISEEKIRGQRNFANKIWNIGRFILLSDNKGPTLVMEDKDLLKEISGLTKSITKDLTGFRFGQAAENLYQFTWHEFADKYIEDYKKGLISYEALLSSFETLLKLLHPFMPFVTEEIWSLIPKKEATPLIISPWPK
ncbi:MAG: valine--tRNA ligase [Patescibacteria group bacterium]